MKYLNDSSIPNFTANGMVWISEVTSATLTSGTTAEANVDIGAGGISNDSLFVSNPGTLLTSSNNVVVGGSTTGNSMVITGGGRVENAVSGIIGSGTGASNNAVTVSGSGSTWASSGSVVVGASGTGNSLVVASGGSLQAGAGSLIGDFYGSNGNCVLVTGSGSSWSNSDFIYVGNVGTNNTLTVSNGGSVTAPDITVGYAAVGSGSNGIVVESRGSIVSQNTYLGRQNCQNSSVLVTGSGSLWLNSPATPGDATRVYVGFDGTNSSLTVANGGAMTATETIIANGAGSSGALNIGRLGNGDLAGTITTSTIAFGAGSGRINFNQSDATTISSLITGSGAVYQLGSGTTILTAANWYAGATTVDAGALLINGDQSAATGAIAVAAGATIGGSGTTGGVVTVNGMLSPGNSPGVFTAASVLLGGSSTSLFQIDGTARGTQYDGVNVTTADGLTYGGALSIAFGNGSAFASNTTFDLFSFTGTPSGNFASVTSTGFYTGTWTLASGIWSLDSGSQTLSFTPATGDLVVAVPEPSTIAMALAGTACGGFSTWRRRKRA